MKDLLWALYEAYAVISITIISPLAIAFSVWVFMQRKGRKMSRLDTMDRFEEPEDNEALFVCPNCGCEFYDEVIVEEVDGVKVCLECADIWYEEYRDDMRTALSEW